MPEKRKPGKSPSGRGRNYTPLREVVHCALQGAVSAAAPVGADDFRRFSICFNHHRGKGQLRCPAPFPCAGFASYPFVGLSPKNPLRCRLLSGNKFYNFILIKMESVLDIYNSYAIMKAWKANFPSERRFA